MFFVEDLRQRFTATSALLAASSICNAASASILLSFMALLKCGFKLLTFFLTLNFYTIHTPEMEYHEDHIV